MDEYDVFRFPPDGISEPSGAQVKIDLKREGTLAWMLSEMIEEVKGYENNILNSPVVDPEQLSKVIDWQARRAVLKQWLDKMVGLMTEENDNGN